jgi:hypothetical protein
LCLLPIPAGDEVVEVVVVEHDLFALLAATNVHVAKIASADEATQHSD